MAFWLISPIPIWTSLTDSSYKFENFWGQLWRCRITVIFVDAYQIWGECVKFDGFEWIEYKGDEAGFERNFEKDFWVDIVIKMFIIRNITAYICTVVYRISICKIRIIKTMRSRREPRNWMLGFYSLFITSAEKTRWFTTANCVVIVSGRFCGGNLLTYCSGNIIICGGVG